MGVKSGTRMVYAPLWTADVERAELLAKSRRRGRTKSAVIRDAVSIGLDRMTKEDDGREWVLDSMGHKDNGREAFDWCGSATSKKTGLCRVVSGAPDRSALLRSLGCMGEDD